MKDWISLHAFYHDTTRQDDLLLDAWVPLLAELREEELLDGHFYERHLAGGPHLRFRLLPADPERGDRVRGRARAALEAYLAEHPSAPPETAVRWGRRGTPGQPDNTVADVPYRAEVARFGGPEAMRVAEAHFRDSTDAVLEVLSRARAGGTEGATFGYALQLGSVLALGAGFGQHTLHRFWEDYDRHLFDERDTVESVERYRTVYLQNREPLLDQFTRLARIEVDWALGGDPLVARWGSAVRATCAQLEAALQARGEEYADEFREFRRRRKYVLVVQAYVHTLWNRLGYWGKREEVLCRLSADVWRDLVMAAPA